MRGWYCEHHGLVAVTEVTIERWRAYCEKTDNQLGHLRGGVESTCRWVEVVEIETAKEET